VRVLLLAVALTLAATEQHFIFNNESEPKTLDPHTMTGIVEARLALAQHEGLVALHPATLAPQPGLAEHWTISADGTVYTFHLRDGLRWSDGTPFTAQDLRASWLRALAPATAAPYAELLDPIVGAQAFREGKGDAAAVGISAPDTRTVIVTLARPCGYFLQLCAFHITFPVPLAAIQAHGERWTQPGNARVMGPFVLDRWLPRERIELVPNPHWHGRAEVRLTRITALPIADQDTSWRLFQQGAIHWMPSIPLAKWDEVRWHPGYYVSPHFATYFYRLNCTRPPFTDARVRRALSLAIDREVLTSQILRAGQVPATWLTPAHGDYRPPTGLATDRDAARRLLAEAGYGPGGAPLRCELLFNTSDAHRQIAEAIASQWKAVLGAEVTLVNREWKMYIADMDRLEYDIARASWVGDFLDPETFVGMWVTGGGNNRTGWSHAGFDALLNEARTERDPARRLERYREAERILVEEQFPIIPLYIYVNQGLLADRVRGWHENVRDEHPFQHLWLAE
jgi:oligopeptide transport system substrate-binding protein